jgi:hypothetical protein
MRLITDSENVGIADMKLRKDGMTLILSVTPRVVIVEEVSVVILWLPSIDFV